MKALLAILLLFVQVHASEIEGNGRISYVVKPEMLSIHLSSQFITRGFPLAPEMLLPVQHEKASDLGDMFKSLGESYQQNIKQTLKSTRVSLEELNVDGTSDLPIAHKTEPIKKDIVKYFSCIESQTLYFEKYFALSRQDYLKGISKDEVIENLKIKLDHERGSLGQRSQEGHLCGMYLGDSGFTELSDSLLYKYLTTLKILNTNQKLQLLAGLIATFHPESPVKDKLVLIDIIQYNMAKIVFQGINHFEFSDLESIYKDLLDENRSVESKDSVVIHQVPINNWQNIQQGLDWALTELRE